VEVSNIRGKRNKSYIFFTILRIVLLVIIIVAFLFPIYWIFTGSFKTNAEFFSNPPKMVAEHYNFQYYINILKSPLGHKSVIDSLIVAIVGSILTLIISIPASYALARYKVGGTQISFFILAQLFLPPVIGLIPLFFIFKTIGLLNTYYVLFISYLFFNLPFAVWIMKGFFEEIPFDLEQAAMVDGHSRFRVFFKIALPLAKPGIAVIALFSFIFSWNEMMFASIFVRNAVKTIPPAILALAYDNLAIRGEIQALAIITLIPGLVLAVVMQKYIVRGLSFGAIKG
jgi:multiple sugar transport system permease protein